MILFALSVAHVAVSVPVVVTGDPVTENSAGSARPTLVTVPLPLEVPHAVPLSTMFPDAPTAIQCPFVNAPDPTRIWVATPRNVYPVMPAAVPLVFAALFGISAETNARKAGEAGEPVVGPEKKVLAVCVPKVDPPVIAVAVCEVTKPFPLVVTAQTWVASPQAPGPPFTVARVSATAPLELVASPVNPGIQPVARTALEFACTTVFAAGIAETASPVVRRLFEFPHCGRKPFETAPGPVTLPPPEGVAQVTLPSVPTRFTN